MSNNRIVVFADLEGSSALFEEVGNVEAAAWVQQITTAIANIGLQRGALLTKLLGDGVLMLFADGAAAVQVALDIQRRFARRVESIDAPPSTRLKVGLSCGPVVEVEGDCYGDAVNVAARLCDMAGGGAIWATRDIVEALPRYQQVRYRDLGTIPIRGLSEPRAVLQIEWDDSQTSDLMTVRGSLDTGRQAAGAAHIELRWLDLSMSFSEHQVPIRLGRAPGCEFPIADPRVSREHARISFDNGNFVLADLSTYGTWVHFADPSGEVALRRGDCVLIGSGELAFGAPISDFTAPTATFAIHG